MFLTVSWVFRHLHFDFTDVKFDPTNVSVVKRIQRQLIRIHCVCRTSLGLKCPVRCSDRTWHAGSSLPHIGFLKFFAAKRSRVRTIPLYTVPLLFRTSVASHSFIHELENFQNCFAYSDVQPQDYIWTGCIWYKYTVQNYICNMLVERTHFRLLVYY